MDPYRSPKQIWAKEIHTFQASRQGAVSLLTLLRKKSTVTKLKFSQENLNFIRKNSHTKFVPENWEDSHCPIFICSYLYHKMTITDYLKTVDFYQDGNSSLCFCYSDFSPFSGEFLFSLSISP